MAIYKRILFATDLTQEAHRHVDMKVRNLADIYEAELHCTHAVESLSAVAYQYIGTVEIQDQLVEEAEKEMKKVCDAIGVNDEYRHVRVGHPKTEIIDLAQELKVDLIIVGSHGRHGLSAIVGSTCNAIIHGAHCDVLVLRATKD